MATMTTASAPYTAAPMVKERPFGVTVLAILFVLEGLVMLLGGIGMVLLGAISGSIDDSFGIGGIFGALFAVIGVVLLIMGILSFLVAWGLYSGKGWARLIAIILAVFGAIFGLLSILTASGIIQLIIAIIILYYLFQPRVKAYFA